MLHCWVASHIDDKIKIPLLKMMCESVIRFNIRIHISISSQPDLREDIERMFLSFIHSHLIEYYYHDSHLKQFEHLRCLYDMLNFEDDDKILFMDDDDLLLYLPNYDKDVIKGYQYIPSSTWKDDGSANMNHDQIMNNPYLEQWKKDIDFSGYISKYSIIKEYFDRKNVSIRDESDILSSNVPGDINCQDDIIESDNKISEIVGCVEDTKFTGFLDEYVIQEDIREDIRENIQENPPFIFHKIYRENNFWKDNMMDELNIFMNDQFSNLFSKMDETINMDIDEEQKKILIDIRDKMMKSMEKLMKNYNKVRDIVYENI